MVKLCALALAVVYFIVRMQCILLLLFAGCSQKDPRMAAWDSRHSTPQQRAQAANELIAPDTPGWRVQEILGRKGVWVHYHGPSLDLIARTNLPPHDDWQLQYDWPNGSVAIIFEPSIGTKPTEQRFVTAMPIYRGSNAPTKKTVPPR